MNAGTIIDDKYQLSREIGQGSMGSVWAAVHMRLDREVAIKFLNPSIEDAVTAAARFNAEAKAAALVKNRFVVDVFDFGTTETGVSYMVQELLEGEPLADVMCEGPAWTLKEAVRFMMDCLSGLSAVHERGLVHRDLKPENIFVLSEGEQRVPKLLDFGISKIAALAPRDKRVPRPSLRTSGRARLTAVGATLGTPAYMSPEQLRNLSSLDARADLYSLGVVMYEWFAGHCPYATTMNYAELVDRIENRELQPLRVLRPELGATLAGIVARAIEPNRDARYASAAEMRSALAQAVDALPEVHTKIQNELPVYVPKGLPPPAITYRPPPAPRVPAFSEPPDSVQTFSNAPLVSASYQPSASFSDASLSLQPAGLRRGPSRGFWMGALTVGLLLAAAPFALRARSRDAHRVDLKTAIGAPLAPPEPAPPATIEPVPAQDLPFGALPPEADPEQGAVPPLPVAEAAPPPAAPDAAPDKPRHHHHHHRSARSEVPARVSSAAPVVAAPKRDAAPAGGSSKLVRSLDF